MAGGLAALLDDVALIAKAASASVDDVAAATAKTSAKAAGVVIDDAAVTPQFVHGVTPARELPIIWRIAKGSLFNKAIIILPIALALNYFAPWALPPLLLIGGLFLSFEGAEKILEAVGLLKHHDDDAADTPIAAQEPASAKEQEKSLVMGAIRTDLILSAEIMIISLAEVAQRSLGIQIAVLLAVALVITAGVYGVVGVLVKLDDIGLRISTRPKASGFGVHLGRVMVRAMPIILEILSKVGTFAMLWVGGHIAIHNLHEIGVDGPHHVVEWLLHATHSESVGAASWVVDTLASAALGLVVGAIITAVVLALTALVSKK